MSQIINPFARQNVQISDAQKMCVLVHRETKRILCFARDDPFARSFQNAGYEVVEIKHAHEFDTWAKKLRQQAQMENDAQDHIQLERENGVRQRLRQQLKDRLIAATDQPTRIWIESAIKTLDLAQARKQRYRKESFMLCEVMEGAEAKSDVGEELVKKIICNE